MTVWVLAALLLSATATSLAFHALQADSARVHSFRNGVREDVELSQRADEVQRALVGDYTPEADSLHDVVWEYIQRQSHSGLRIALEDISSNEEQCPYTNLNTAPLSGLGDLFLDHGVARYDAASAIEILRDSRRDGRRASVTELAGPLGSNFRFLRPLLTTRPMHNVNLATERSLRRILDNDRRTSVTHRACAEIISLRQTIEIDRSRLDSLLSEAADPAHSAWSLGVRTWTWRLRVTDGARQLVRLLARIDAPPPPAYVRIGNRYEGEHRETGRFPRRGDTREP